MAISRLRPDSINQLAKFVNREYPHVLKDCRSLEVLGFIALIEAESIKKQFTPKLAFDYDIIRVKSKIEELFPITEESNRILLDSMAV
jgi:predicted transcriptional regulator